MSLTRRLHPEDPEYVPKGQHSLSVPMVQMRKREVIKLLLDGRTVRQCADIVGVTHHTIVNYLREPEFREELRSLHSDLLNKLDSEFLVQRQTRLQIIDELSFKALERMRGILDDPDAHVTVVAKVATDVLDRHPETSRQKKLDITEKRINLSGEDLLGALQAMKDIEERRKLKAAEAVEEAQVLDNPTNDSRID